MRTVALHADGRPVAVADRRLRQCRRTGRGRYKFVHSDPDPDQLFDLEADPLELNNLAEAPEYQDLRKQFRDEVASRWDTEKLHQAVLDSQRRRKLVARANMKGLGTPWDHHPQFDASTQYMRNTIDLDDLEARARFPAPAGNGA